MSDNQHESREFTIGGEYVDKANRSHQDDQFARWVTPNDGPSIKNMGGIRTQKIMDASGGDDIANLFLITTHIRTASDNPWTDLVDLQHARIEYWGDAKADTDRAFPGNKVLKRLKEFPVANQPPILHFTRVRTGILAFNGLCVIESVVQEDFQDPEGNTVDNVKVTLSILDAVSVPCEWLVNRVRFGDSADKLPSTPDVWNDFRRGIVRKLDRTAITQNSGVVLESISSQIVHSSPSYWAIGLGEQGRLWDQCQEEGDIRIGWDMLGDLRKFPDRESMAVALRAERDPGGAEPYNDSLACFEFLRKMKPGDYVVAKIGRSKLLGLGVVQGDYEYRSTRQEYRNTRKVRWIKVESLELPKDAWVPIKTLTDCTGYAKFVDFVIDNWITEEPTKILVEQKKTYTTEEALDECFLPRLQFESILEALRRKKNVVLQGAPGVGKTFLARRIAFAFIQQKDPERAPMVQFHQSYGYEDFIQGFRPGSGTSQFHRQDGLFLTFCNKARTDRDRPYVFIIDEINRGNLSKIFGELLMLIEADKRGSEFAIRLTYGTPDDPPFSVPANVHIVGLMNTADRSLALVDYALRRRFVFFNLTPQFSSLTYQKRMIQLGAAQTFVDRLVARLNRLNKEISDDATNLGEGFAVGHSFFCPTETPSDWERWYNDIVRYEVGPLLNEYWFDDPTRANNWIEDLLSS